MLAIAGIACALTSPPTSIDAFLATLDSKFAWHDTNYTSSYPLLGVDVKLLNVTSQQWLTTAEAYGPNGDLWTHQVAVTIPRKINFNDSAYVVLTGGCNEAGPDGHPKPMPNDDEYLELVATMSAKIGIVGVVVYQLPNCHYIYTSDPSKKHRSEDAMMSWGWKQYLEQPVENVAWLPWMPMAKAGLSCMRAVDEFLGHKHNWVVGGASKRGWTTWLIGVGVGGGQCSWCPTVTAITPMVPIVPFLNHSVHLQRQSLGAFTFAFKDYIDAGIMSHGAWQSPRMAKMLQLTDPSSAINRPRLASLSKLAIVSSDDEFMQMDWTEYGWTELPGEMHLLVVPNSEHSLATGIPSLIESASAFVSSVSMGEERAKRPQFSFSRDTNTGKVTVTVPPGGVLPSKVVLRHTQTLSRTRRDFRWVRKANSTSPCTPPGFKISPVIGGGNCAQPMLWIGETLQPMSSASSPGGGSGSNGTTWVATPKDPRHGHWRGYFVELYYPSDVLHKDDTLVTTPGYVWPDTLPYPDCKFGSPGCEPWMV